MSELEKDLSQIVKELLLVIKEKRVELEKMEENFTYAVKEYNKLKESK